MINLALNLLDEWPMKSQAVRIVSHKASDQNEIYVNEIGEIYTADNERIGQIRTKLLRWKIMKFGFSSRIVKSSKILQTFKHK